MTIAEAIMEHVTSLPEPDQTEVLDFVEYLESKKNIKKNGKDNWSIFSLSQAMRGMETEDSLYSPADIKERIA